ncbi:MAG TPA: hypothetical protein VLV81_09365 [Acidimicrobiia bacterium]|nr:hypothetical protein [Acidimicrobiia bacterium]
MTSALSPLDDFPVHQVAEVMRHPATSDRNFYDRYYFMLHSSDDELMMIMGFGQYPNLSVQDAFGLVRRGSMHRVVRASRRLGLDRMDLSVGPFRIEVLEGLKRVRYVLDANEHGLSFDLEWTGAIAPHLEERHYIRSFERVTFDTERFAQTGFWAGTVTVGDDTVDVTGGRWRGVRDRSWGVRPIGEPEPPGIAAGGTPSMSMWNYAPMQFDDYSIVYICSESPDGTRNLVDTTRVWNDPDRAPDQLGRAEHAHEFRSGTRMIDHSVLSFPDAPGGSLSIDVTPLIQTHIGVGTGYGMDQDWRHGMYQGDLVVQGVDLDTTANAERFFGIVDASARFETNTGDVGYGLHEYMFLGPFPKYGLTGLLDGAP